MDVSCIVLYSSLTNVTILGALDGVTVNAIQLLKQKKFENASQTAQCDEIQTQYTESRPEACRLETGPALPSLSYTTNVLLKVHQMQESTETMVL